MNYFFKKFFIPFSLSVYIAVILLLLFKHNDINGIESTDSYVYLMIAKSSAEGKAFSHSIYSPGYSWITALIYRILGDLEISGRIVSFVFGILSVILFFFLVRTFFGTTHAFLSASFLAVNPDFVLFEVSTLPYTTSFFFFWFSVYLSFLSSRENKKISYIFSFLSGLVGGFGYVVRPELLLLFISYVLITKSFRKFLFFALGFFISSLPYHIITFHEGYVPSFISKFLNYRLPELSSPTMGDFQKKISGDSGFGGVELLFKKIVSIKTYLKTFMSNVHLTHKYAIPNLMTASQIFVSGMGFAFFIFSLFSRKIYDGDESREKQNRKMGLFVFLYAFFAYLPVFFLIIIADYIILPVFLPILSLFAGFLSYPLELYRKSSSLSSSDFPFSPWSLKGFSVAVLSTFIFMMFLNIFYFMRPFYKDEGRKVFKIAGKWIKENLGADLVIYEPFPFTTFYADGIWTMNMSRAEIGVFSPINVRTPQDVLYYTLPPEKIEYGELITEISYKGKFVRIFRFKKQEGN